MRRNKNIDGHIVPEATFANTHAISKENFLRLADEFGDKVLYIITEVKNVLKEPVEISIEELENKPKYTKEQIQEAIHAETYSEARAILEGFKNSNDSESLKRISPVVEGTIIQQNNETGKSDRRTETTVDGLSGRTEELIDDIRFSVAPQTDTPAFKEWFGDSKVVDENGEPLIVYHGSGTTFWEFKIEFTGFGNDQYGSGFYFTTDKETADIYTEKQLNGKTKIGGQDS